MPIVYLHGVAIRDQRVAPIMTALLTKYVAPVVLPGLPATSFHERIFSAYWGNHGVGFAWHHASLPVIDLSREDGTDALPTRTIQLLKERSERAAPGIDAPTTVLSADQLSYILTAALNELTVGNAPSETSDAVHSVRYGEQIVALDRAVRELMPEAGASSVTDQMLQEIAQKVGRLLPVGALFDASRLVMLAKDSLHPHDAAGGRLSEKIVMSWRPALDAVITQFLGDVFVYLTQRGDEGSPGPIVTDFLEVLLHAAQSRAKEPLIVFSHSMGGQIVYDCLTYYIPRIKKYSKLKVDFWVATGSQVALFEEMKLLKVSDASIRAPRKVDLSNAHVGYWYNVWDPGDILSYTAQPIFNGVDDEKFESRLPLHTAHFGYLVCPAFYRRLAEKVRSAIS